ncbi:MAG: DNA-directed RNA polymerase subunit beta [Ferrimicrobium sp.]|uniref:DNA-directed RNA polymerase subunit beta n=1 Tax=Ferrimicrobium sp. TaxID=2926050 RepID=UPI002639F1C1|nr:DNA-directed RNA polymerase subunit beta [Ferrimicrobium sp.]
MTLLNRSPQRFSFAKLPQVLPLPDLIAIQTDSFRWFLEEGLAEAFHDISPIEDYGGQLSLELEYDPNDPDLAPFPKYSVEECKEKDMNYAAPIFVRAKFSNKSTYEIKEQIVFMGDFPLMTDRGTFVINGTERVIVSQLVRSPGVLFQPGRDQRTIVTATINPYRGEWLEFDVEARPGRDIQAGARVARKRRLSLFTLLRAVGFSDPADLQKLVQHFDFLIPQWEKEDQSQTEDEALLEVFKRVRPGEPPNADAARMYLEGAFFQARRYDLTRVGRYKIDKRLKPEIARLEDILGHPLDTEHETPGVLSRAEVVATASYMLHLASGELGYRYDDQDHFSNRRVRSVGELIQNQLKIGLSRLERLVRERMTTQDVEAITPQSLINIRPVVAAVKEFFSTSQLSQFMDQNNPLSGLAHKRRLSALGPGGLSRERAGFEVRDVHSSHYGRMCPIETPEGPNIGLIGALASYARLNRFGFIETPYRKVVEGRVTDDIVYLTADEEEEFIIAQANARLDADGRFIEPKVLVRRGPQGAVVKVGVNEVSYGSTSEVELATPDEVHLMDVSTSQVVSVSTSLIPFVEHDDANRALMGANMQKQAVPLMIPEAPFVGTGVEARAGLDAGDVLVAKGAGVVTEVTGDSIVVDYDKGQTDGNGVPLGTKRYRLVKFERSNQNTCWNQRPLVDQGDRVQAGDLLADGPATQNGELGLGKNLLVGFMPWEGYNFEDAIIISERLVKDDVLSSIHIEEFETDARDTKLGAEEITRDIPNLSEEALADLDERGIIRVGAEVGPGDILVGKVTPKGETELTPEERLLRAIFGEKSREVRDTSLRVPHGEYGKVIDIKVFSRDDSTELPPGVNQLVRVYVAQHRKISEGDKLAGRHGNKGVISKILPLEDMPRMADGTPLDIILNPLGVPSRMNVGQVLEGHLGFAAKWGWTPVEAPEQLASLSHKTRPRAIPNTWVASPSFDGAHWDETEEAGGLPTIKELLTNLNPQSFDGNRLVGEDGKAQLFNGRTGEPYDSPVMVGYVYMIKLAHMVDDKIHARSTGPYSMITQQPLGGKAQFGGQRFGEMEVWALEAYGAAYALQELLTIKSDDVVGRVKVYESIVKGENIPEPGIPESFKVLIKEMQSLCLNVDVLSPTGERVQLRELDEDAYSASEDLGINLSRPERNVDYEDDGRQERGI